jgi:hypothetical protein
MGGHVHGGFIDNDSVPHHPGDPHVDVPTVSQHQLTMLDDDGGTCHPVNAWGYAPWYLPYAADYVDNIASFSFRPSDPFGFSGIENDPIEITLVSGASVSIPRSSIAAAPGGAATALRRSGGVVYPADDGYNMQLNDTNTPNLVGLDNYILYLTQAAAAERLKMAEIVAAFAENIAQLGHAGSHESIEIVEKVRELGTPAH